MTKRNATPQDELAIKDFLKTTEKEMIDTLCKGTSRRFGPSGHRYWKIRVNPSYDNVVGGYNAQVFATDVVNRDQVLDPEVVKMAKEALKELPYISRVKTSPAYRKKYKTVLAIGFKPKSFLKEITKK